MLSAKENNNFILLESKEFPKLTVEQLETKQRLYVFMQQLNYSNFLLIYDMKLK